MKKLVLQRESIYKGDLILVNRRHKYRGQASDYLIPVREQEKYRQEDSVLMCRRPVLLLSMLMGEIKGWRKIEPVSGWRSFEEQKKIWDDSMEDSGKEFTEKYVAVPGHSEHQTGLAIDLGLKQPEIDFIRPHFPYTGICQCFREKAAGYGFVERYPQGKEEITGISHEPWHFRYVGVPHAKVMNEKNLVLEEYISFIKQFPYGKNEYVFSCENQDMRISYLRAEPEGRTEMEIDETLPYSVSGNNSDGFIITQWGKKS